MPTWAECKYFNGRSQALLTSPANPFALRDTHNSQAVWTYKILTIVTWLVTVISSIYYTYGLPNDDHKAWRNSIWGHNRDIVTPFSLNALITSLYW
jgi:hypothetical protein